SILKRLQGRQLASFLDEYKKGRIDPKKATEFLKDFKVDTAGSKFKDLSGILERVKQPGGFSALSKQDREDLLAKLQKMRDEVLGGLGAGDLSTKKETTEKDNKESNPAETSGAGGGASSEPESPEPGASSPLAERLIGLTEKLAPALRKSPALQ